MDWSALPFDAALEWRRVASVGAVLALPSHTSLTTYFGLGLLLLQYFSIHRDRAHIVSTRIHMGLSILILILIIGRPSARTRPAHTCLVLSFVLCR